MCECQNNLGGGIASKCLANISICLENQSLLYKELLHSSGKTTVCSSKFQHEIDLFLCWVVGWKQKDTPLLRAETPPGSVEGSRGHRPGITISLVLTFYILKNVKHMKLCVSWGCNFELEVLSACPSGWDRNIWKVIVSYFRRECFVHLLICPSISLRQDAQFEG